MPKEIKVPCKKIYGCEADAAIVNSNRSLRESTDGLYEALKNFFTGYGKDDEKIVEKWLNDER